MAMFPWLQSKRWWAFFFLLGVWLYSPSVQALPVPAHWTLMIYMAGDNDLEEYIVKDLERELAAVGSTAQVQIVALADRIPGYDKSRGNWTTTQLFHVTQGQSAHVENAVADWGERNMGNPQTLLDFVTWSKKHYPAQHYALYFWGHGWNWHSGYTMEDKTSKDALDPHEMKPLLPQLGSIDLVAYDGCNMGALEVESLWYGHAAAIVHSQEYVEWDGIEYDVVLCQLQHNPQMNAQQLAVVTNLSASRNAEKTGSAVALDQRFKQLLQVLDEWSRVLLNNLPNSRWQYDKAFRATQHFFEAPEDLDLYHLVSQIAKYTTEPVIQAKSQQLMNALQAVILNEWHTPDYPQAHGISISQVNPHDPLFKQYRALDLAQYTYWDEFLAAYLDTPIQKSSSH